MEAGKSRKNKRAKLKNQLGLIKFKYYITQLIIDNQNRFQTAKKTHFVNNKMLDAAI